MYNFRNCNKFYVTICIYPLVDSRTDTGERTPDGWGTAVSGHGNVEGFYL